jgi:hypothetical protein
MLFRYQNSFIVVLLITASAILSASIFLEQASAIVTKCKAIDGLPDRKCTPGTTDPRVTQQNIKDTICKSGYTKTVRPPVSVTNQMKLVSMKEYGFSDSPSNYEYDHLISLELGGAPKDPKNLWPESYLSTPTSHDKDKFENYLHKQVCSGKISLRTAQLEISLNWFKYWVKAGRP